MLVWRVGVKVAIGCLLGRSKSGLMECPTRYLRRGVGRVVGRSLVRWRQRLHAGPHKGGGRSSEVSDQDINHWMSCVFAPGAGAVVEWVIPPHRGSECFSGKVPVQVVPERYGQRCNAYLGSGIAI